MPQIQYAKMYLHRHNKPTQIYTFCLLHISVHSTIHRIVVLERDISTYVRTYMCIELILSSIRLPFERSFVSKSFLVKFSLLPMHAWPTQLLYWSNGKYWKKAMEKTRENTKNTILMDYKFSHSPPPSFHNSWSIYSRPQTHKPAGVGGCCGPFSWSSIPWIVIKCFPAFASRNTFTARLPPPNMDLTPPAKANRGCIQQIDEEGFPYC